MCVGKNTSQSASVEFLRSAQKLCAQQIAIPLAENSAGIFCQSKSGGHPASALKLFSYLSVRSAGFFLLSMGKTVSWFPSAMARNTSSGV